MSARRTRTLAAWLALAAIVLAALAPSVARTLASTDDGGWQEVCSADGPRPGGTPDLALMNHCPWCTLQGQAMAPPPASADAPAGLRVVEAAPVPDTGPAVTLRSWSNAAPRGPPAYD